MQISIKVSYKLILWFLMEVVKHSRSSQNSKFAVSLQYLKKEVGMKLTFCMQINIKVSYKLISTLWVSKFRTRWYYHDQAFSSLQYLKKEVRDEVHFFCRQINIKVFTTRHYHFWWKWPDMLKVPKVILLWCKTLRYYTEVQ